MIIVITSPTQCNIYSFIHDDSIYYYLQRLPVLVIHQAVVTQQWSCTHNPLETTQLQLSSTHCKYIITAPTQCKQPVAIVVNSLQVYHNSANTTTHLGYIPEDNLFRSSNDII